MMSATLLVPSLARTSPFFSLLTKIPRVLFCPDINRACLQVHSYRPSLYWKPILPDICVGHFSLDRVSTACTLAVSAASSVHDSTSATDTVSKKSRKKAHHNSPGAVLKHKLGVCSKENNLIEALRLYEEARSNGVQLNQSHYNSLLYLCSSYGSAETSSNGDANADACNLGLERGFEIFHQMVIDKVAPNEATFTNAARIAAAKEDPEMAFDLLKQMKNFGIPPKLRSYGPALFGFCKKGMADEAYEVDAHMIASGVLAEEPELSALLKVSSEVKKSDKVYEMLHRLRTTVRQVSESTAGIIQDWFRSEDAAQVGVCWDAGKVKEGVVKGGGGWHGQGWLGSGNWTLVRTQMDVNGVCHSCGRKLVCIDIDPKETDNFATSLTSLACQREVKADFVKFQEWLQRHGPFDAVIDGANVGLVDQYKFSFFQLKNVVNRLREISPSKRLPLVILHRSRVTGGPAQNPNNKKLLESWKNSGSLYATPLGSNDDWYWLYAAVSCKCLLVTNDEMRDHLFQLLGTSFFPRWKEKHQIRLSASRQGLILYMPPPYSIVIQESEDGSWHIPTTTGDDLESPRHWLCATRAHDKLREKCNGKNLIAKKLSSLL